MGGQHEHLKNNTNPQAVFCYQSYHCVGNWQIGKKHTVTTNVKISNKRSALPRGGLLLPSPPVAPPFPVAPPPPVAPAPPPVKPALENKKKDKWLERDPFNVRVYAAK